MLIVSKRKARAVSFVILRENNWGAWEQKREKGHYCTDRFLEIKTALGRILEAGCNAIRMA